jgi:hypothetical protein
MTMRRAAVRGVVVDERRQCWPVALPTVATARTLPDLRSFPTCQQAAPYGRTPSSLATASLLPTRSRLVTARATTASLATGTVVKVPEAGAEIRWGSFLSKEEDLEAAVDEAVRAIQDSIGEDVKPELALVFVSSLHGEEFDRVVPLLRKRVPSLRHIFGCSVRSQAPAVAGASAQTVNNASSM